MAVKKTKALGVLFLLVFALQLISDYALIIMWDWQVFTWMFIWSGYRTFAVSIES